MVSEIIEKYNNGYNLEKLALEYKMGKLNIKAILMNNNISIKKKGGQIKNKKIEINYSKWDDKNVTCNCCVDILQRLKCVGFYHQLELLLKRSLTFDPV